MIFFGEALSGQLFDVLEVRMTIQAVDSAIFALQEDPVTGAQRHVGEIGEAIATLAQYADDGDVEARAEAAVTHEFADQG